MLTEDGLYDDYEFFKEQLIECKSILSNIVKNTKGIVSKSQDRKKMERNIHHLKNIAKSLNKIKQMPKKVVFSCNQNEPSQIYNKVFIFPLDKNDDIYVDLNNPINSNFYKSFAKSDFS